MKKNLLLALLASTLFAIQSCKHKKDVPEPDVQRCEPSLLCGVPVEDTVTHTFSLSVSSDCTSGATVTFYLVDFNDTLMVQSGDSATFSGIEPLDDGYFVSMRAEWPGDTTILCTEHVSGFVILQEPVDSITEKELEELINSKDKTLRRNTNSRIAQTAKLNVINSLRQPVKLRDVINLIDNGEWKSVHITNIVYDENNLVVSITLEPVGEQALPDTVNVEEIEVFDDL